MMEKIAALVVIGLLVGLILFAAGDMANAEERISDIVISVRLSPGTIKPFWATINFLDDRIKTFTYSTLVHEIRVHELNIIYYEENQITKIERYNTI